MCEFAIVERFGKKLEIDEKVSILKTNPENQISKRFENKLNDYSANFEPAINQVENYLRAVKEAQEAQAKIDASRSAQKAENEKIAQEGKEAFQKLKTAENWLYREHRSDVSQDQDKSLDNDNTYRPL